MNGSSTLTHRRLTDIAAIDEKENEQGKRTKNRQDTPKTHTTLSLSLSAQYADIQADKHNPYSNTQINRIKEKEERKESKKRLMMQNTTTTITSSAHLGPRSKSHTPLPPAPSVFLYHNSVPRSLSSDDRRP